MPGSVADAEFGAFVIEARQRDAGIHVQADVRMARAEARQPRQQPAVGERMQCGDAQGGGLAGQLQVRGHGVDIAQRRIGGIRQLPAFQGQLHAARVALEQDHAQQRLQLAHVVADGTRREVQFVGGVGEVLVARGGGENPEGGQQGGAQAHGSLQTQARFVAWAYRTRL